MFALNQEVAARRRQLDDLTRQVQELMQIRDELLEQVQELQEAAARGRRAVEALA
jgi:predicted  nucleic acid-binding Zn-ribbon protein